MTNNARDIFERHCELQQCDSHDLERDESGHYIHADIGDCYDAFMYAWDFKEEQIRKLDDINHEYRIAYEEKIRNLKLELLVMDERRIQLEREISEMQSSFEASLSRCADVIKKNSVDDF